MRPVSAQYCADTSAQVIEGHGAVVKFKDVINPSDTKINCCCLLLTLLCGVNFVHKVLRAA